MNDIQTDTRDRLIQVETNLKHAVAELEDMGKKLTTLHELMLQARGAAAAGRWAGHGLTAVIAFGVSQAGALASWPLPR